MRTIVILVMFIQSKIHGRLLLASSREFGRPAVSAFFGNEPIDVYLLRYNFVFLALGLLPDPDRFLSTVVRGPV